MRYTIHLSSKIWRGSGAVPRDGAGMNHRLISALLRNGAMLFSLGMSLAGAIYVARYFSISIWVGIILIHLTCVIVLTLLLLTESFVSWLSEYLRRNGRKPDTQQEGFGISKSSA